MLHAPITIARRAVEGNLLILTSHLTERITSIDDSRMTMTATIMPVGIRRRGLTCAPRGKDFHENSGIVDEPRIGVPA